MERLLPLPRTIDLDFQHGENRKDAKRLCDGTDPPYTTSMTFEHWSATLLKSQHTASLISFLCLVRAIGAHQYGLKGWNVVEKSISTPHTSVRQKAIARTWGKVRWDRQRTSRCHVLISIF